MQNQGRWLVTLALESLVIWIMRLKTQNYAKPGKADIIVIMTAICLVAYLYALFWGQDRAYRAEIRVGGMEPQVISLRIDQTIEVEGAIGKSVIEVKNGSARFLSSPCDAKLCIRSGWLKHAHELAACLPNGVTLYIMGEDAFDAINF
jgi:hypothetical protein